MLARDDGRIRTLADVERFEREKPFEERCAFRSVYDIFVHGAQRFPDNLALTFLLSGSPDETPRDVSYRELLQGVTRAANFFRDIGGPSPGVAVMLPHLVDTHYALWGAETAGYALPINFLLQTDHVAHLVRASGASVLVALGPTPQLDLWEKAVAVSKFVPGLKLVQVSPPNVPVQDGAIGWGQSLARYDGNALTFGKPNAEDDVAAYFHTGGTTGTPKLVAHTHRNQIVAGYGGALMLEYSDKDVLPHGLPLFHVAGTIACGLSILMAGARILILSPGGFRNPQMVQQMWKISERFGATISGGVPTVMAALLNVPLDGADISSVRIALSGGAAAPKSVIREFEEKTGVRHHELYGMTECGGLATVMPAAAERVVGSVGVRLPYTRTSVRRLGPDGSLGEECPPHEIGVLTISGPTITPGYRGSDGGTIRDGMLDSGDLAYTDEEGRIYIAGRAKDLIIRSGHNIDPQMIEDAVQRHPAVSVVAAVAEPDRYAGELPVCYVALKPGASASVDELRAFAEPLIAERPAWPKRYYIVDAIPVTGVGKIFKPELRIDAVRRFVSQAVSDAIRETAVVITVSAGGKRGMNVGVSLARDDAALRRKVEETLEGYSFDFTVT
jgi:fatty-acyl-CoA synthase